MVADVAKKTRSMNRTHPPQKKKKKKGRNKDRGSLRLLRLEHARNDAALLAKAERTSYWFTEPGVAAVFFFFV
jgi:hypothetical protein